MRTARSSANDTRRAGYEHASWEVEGYHSTTRKGTAMAQTKADRQEAAKKGAATRERNRTREESKERGTKAAATRQGNQAADSAQQAKRSAVGGIKSAARSAGDAAKQAGKSVATRSKTKKD
jgi:hypothetical protein